MNLHLFSTPGEPFLHDVLEVSKSLLGSQRNPVVLYLPAASVERHFIRETRAAFSGLAKVITIKVESHTSDKVRAAVARVNLLFIPGGNTYLLA
jgi:peptidase E